MAKIGDYVKLVEILMVLFVSDNFNHMILTVSCMYVSFMGPAQLCTSSFSSFKFFLLLFVNSCIVIPICLS